MACGRLLTFDTAVDHAWTWSATVRASSIQMDANPATELIDQPFALVLRPSGAIDEDTEDPPDSGGASLGGADCLFEDDRCVSDPHIPA